MGTLTISKDKAPVRATAYRSDGNTIPWVAAGGEVPGDLIVRAAALQQLGQVQALTDQMENAAAAADDEIQLRITGMIWAPKEAEALSDADMVTWHVTNQNFTKTGIGYTTGSHEVVGDYAAGDTHCLVRLNIAPRAAT